MTPADILNAAADLLESSPTAWTQDYMARTSTGRVVDPEHRLACSFCALGAIDRVAEPTSDAAYRAVAKLRSATDESIAIWNDVSGRTREEVIAAFRKAATL